MRQFKVFAFLENIGIPMNDLMAEAFDDLASIRGSFSWAMPLK